MLTFFRVRRPEDFLRDVHRDLTHFRQRLSHALLIEARDAQQHYWQHPLDLLIARSRTRFEADMCTQPLAYNMIVIVQVAVCIARDAQVENVM